MKTKGPNDISALLNRQTQRLGQEKFELSDTDSEDSSEDVKITPKKRDRKKVPTTKPMPKPLTTNSSSFDPNYH